MEMQPEMKSNVLDQNDRKRVLDASHNPQIHFQNYFKNNLPLISIVIPVFNQERYLIDTIKTLQQQTYQNWEAICVDDASTDKSLEILESISDSRIRIVHLEKNVGVAKCRNAGTCVANGRYLAFLDADDLWKPEKLEHQLDFMDKTGCAFSFTDYEFADSQGIGTGKVTSIPSQITYQRALGNTTIFTSTVMLDRTKIPQELLLMPQVESEDTATWWRILKAGFMGYGLQENLTYYRRPAKKSGVKTMSSNKIKALQRIWRLYRKQEKLPLIASCWYFCQYAFHAVLRRV